MKTKGIKKILKFVNKEGITINMPAVVPAYRSDFDDWYKLPNEKLFKLNITQSRSDNKNLHDQFMAIIFFTYNNFPEYKYNFRTSRLFKLWLFVKIEFVDIVSYGNQIIKFPKSIEFDKTDHLEFMEMVYNPGLDYCANVLNMSRDDLINASIEYGYNRALYKGKG